MTSAQRDGLYLLLLGAAAFLLFAFVKASVSPGPMLDFRRACVTSRCLIEKRDPYRPSDLLRLYRAEGATYPADNDPSIGYITRNIYPPSEAVVMLPFALLPRNAAQWLWVGVITGFFLAAAAQMWMLSARHAPVLAGLLLGLTLAQSFSQLFYGNEGCLDVGLICVAAGCLLLERWEIAGVVCMAAALALKPHDSGLVWLFFLLAGGRLRHRAWQSLAVAGAVSLPALLWTWHLSAHWPHEWLENLRAVSMRGAIGDAGPTAVIEHGTCAITSLQALWSNLRDEPGFYNLASMAVVVPLLLLWGIVTLRFKPEKTTAWLGLAVIAPLTLLPVYHRIYDAKLLILIVPACAVLWAEGRRPRWVALALTTLTLLVTGEILWAIILAGVKHLHLSPEVFHGRAIAALFSIPVPLILLVTGCFFLWVYVRRCRPTTTPAESFSTLESHANVQLS